MRRTVKVILREGQMPRYLIEASYNAEGMQGVLAKGGTARREAIEKMLSDVGGTLESFDFAFGDTDVYVIVDVPDAVTVAGVAMRVGASGAARCTTTPLITPEEIDQAAQVKATYRTPGS
jgi:uncharacterized protein with GYD domain